MNSFSQPYQRHPLHQMRSPETELIEQLTRLERYTTGRMAVHLHLSDLEPHNRRTHHLKLAKNSFDEALGMADAQTYMMRNGDLICLARGTSTKQISAAIDQARFLFGEDPLTSPLLNGDDRFCTQYDLSVQHSLLIEQVKYLRDMADADSLQQLHEDEASKNGGTTEVPNSRKPLEPKQLDQLEDRLKGADLSNLVRNQPIYSMLPETPPQRVFQEIFVSIADLEATVIPGVDLTGNQWLFQSLTRTLDQRVLSHLGYEKEYLQRNYSLNLNISTVLSQAFQSFDEKISPELRKRLIIELQYLDIISDINSYKFARDYLHSRGYQICLDGINYQMLPMIDRSLLKADLIKLQWHSDLGATPEKLYQIRQEIKRQGSANFVLCRCDSPNAIEVGQHLKIPMFQGHYIDSLIRDGNHHIM